MQEWMAEKSQACSRKENQYLNNNMWEMNYKFGKNFFRVFGGYLNTWTSVNKMLIPQTFSGTLHLLAVNVARHLLTIGCKLQVGEGAGVIV